MLLPAALLLPHLTFAGLHSCTTINSPSTNANNGDLMRLTGISANCNLATSGRVMRQIYLRREGGLDRWYWQYECCSTNDQANNVCTSMATTPDLRHSEVIYLDRHDLDCGPNRIMARWQAVEPSSQLQVQYDCCTVPPGVSSCTDYNTPTDTDGSKSTWYLDRHNVNCPGGMALQRYWMHRPTSSTIAVSYRCCVLNDWPPPPPSPPPPSPPPPPPPPPCPPPPAPPPPPPPPSPPPPTAAPSRSPTTPPTAAPTKNPTRVPTPFPSSVPTGTPTLAPSRTPTRIPSGVPSVSPTMAPSAAPTVAPSGSPTTEPSPFPSSGPTLAPTVAPSVSPTAVPSGSPTVEPSAAPTAAPTTAVPTAAPTVSPTSRPSVSPTANPTTAPTAAPTTAPSTAPTASPTVSPSRNPSGSPTTAPTTAPTAAPSESPTVSPTEAPSTSPTTSPTSAPTMEPTSAPTTAPSGAPTQSPTRDPTANPTLAPTRPPSTSPSTAPTVSPTWGPTTAPTVSPTMNPTTSPTRNPSAAPTTAPTRNPSVPPTALPSDSPSTAPTAVPSTSPTAAPSGAPSVRPSAGPSQGPTAEPSPQPSALPSLPPTGRPSTVPSSASPSVPPSLPPTAVPSNRTMPPSVPPSAAPSVPPESSPSAAPSPAPEQAAETVAVGATTAGAAVGVAAASAPAAAQAGRLTILTEGCSGGKADPGKGTDHFPWIMHPTGLSIDGFVLPNAAGCIVANLSILIGFALLHFAASRIAGMVRRVGQVGGQAFVRFPSGPLMGAAILTQGTTLAGARLARHASGAGDAFLGVFAIAAGFSVPLISKRGGDTAQKHCVYKRDPHTRSGCSYWWLGYGEWLSTDNKEMVERWGAAFRATMPSRHGVLALDLTLTQLAMLSAGFGGGGCVACGIMRIGDMLFAGILITSVLLKRPYARPLRLPLTLIAQSLLFIGSGVLSVGYFMHCRPVEAIAAPFLAAAGGLILVIAAIDVSGTLRAMQIGRREQLRNLMNHFRDLDKDGSGELDEDELRYGLQRIWRRDIPEKEFAELFALVDADGSGQVSLHEFLSSEHLFWDAGTARPEGVDNDSDLGNSSLLTVSQVATNRAPTDPPRAQAVSGRSPGSPRKGRRTVHRRLELGQSASSGALRSPLQRRSTRRLGRLPTTRDPANMSIVSMDSSVLQPLTLQSGNVDQLCGDDPAASFTDAPSPSSAAPGLGRGHYSRIKSVRLPQTAAAAHSPRRRQLTALARGSSRVPISVSNTMPSGIESRHDTADSQEMSLAYTAPGEDLRDGSPVSALQKSARRLMRSSPRRASEVSPRASSLGGGLLQPQGSMQGLPEATTGGSMRLSMSRAGSMFRTKTSRT
eukprot:TRINITY_DN15867_c0_g1_i1.p1 TRINITY_DN15867_c0_g1~~TRINITY_DN15867_c0_g1_i1.p1  ORF type:complete len:1381 (+),score=107.70 TRINITY_DN15867_c0_g1_i1:95-4144(+)